MVFTSTGKPVFALPRLSEVFHCSSRNNPVAGLTNGVPRSSSASPFSASLLQVIDVRVLVLLLGRQRLKLLNTTDLQAHEVQSVGLRSAHLVALTYGT